MGSQLLEKSINWLSSIIPIQYTTTATLHHTLCHFYAQGRASRSWPRGQDNTPHSLGTRKNGGVLVHITAFDSPLLQQPPIPPVSSISKSASLHSYAKTPLVRKHSKASPSPREAKQTTTQHIKSQDETPSRGLLYLQHHLHFIARDL